MIGQIKAEEGCVWVRTVQNTLKEGGTESRRGKTKILKRQSKLGQGVGALKRRGLESPYELWCYTQHDLFITFIGNTVESLYSRHHSCKKKCSLYRHFFEDSLTAKQSTPFLVILSVLCRCLLYSVSVYRDSTVWNVNNQSKVATGRVFTFLT